MDTGHRSASRAAADIRLLGPDDADASSRMSAEAFGTPPAATPAFTLGEGLWRWGLFDGNTVAAKANDRAYDSMIGGRPVPTAGVAGVAVAPEYRGAGLARRVMRHLLETARQRGAVVATLFRTAPALYRSLGFENVAELRTVELPAAALGGMRVPGGVTLRRAGIGDVPAVRGVYDAVAAGSSCLLTRVGQSFPGDDAGWLAQPGEVTVAVDVAGQVMGYARWERGTGYGPGAVLSVTDLHAVTADGYAALLAMIGSFAAVTPVIRLRSSGTDPVSWFVAGGGWAVTRVEPYLLRVIDLAGAVAARGWPATVAGSVRILVDDPVCPWNSGEHLLEVRGGEGRLVGAESRDAGAGQREAGAWLEADDVTVPLAISARGLAVLYAGGVQPNLLRRAGLLQGGTADDDAFLASAFAGPQPAIFDYF